MEEKIKEIEKLKKEIEKLGEENRSIFKNIDLNKQSIISNKKSIKTLILIFEPIILFLLFFVVVKSLGY
jgi:hypothetical protein